MDCATSVAPEDSNLYFLRALAKGAPGNHEHAIEDYNQTIEFDPEKWPMFLYPE